MRLTQVVKKFEQFGEVIVAGSLRRGRSFNRSKDVDLVIVRTTNDNSDVVEWVEERFKVRWAGNAKIGLSLGRKNIDIRFCRRGYVGAMLLTLTGPAEFNIRLRSLAKARGLKLNEYGYLSQKA